MIKAAWLGRYDQAPERNSFQRVVLSCDPAGKAGAHNDYTAITIVGVQKQALHVLHVSRGHWTVMQMREQIIALAALWRVDLVIIGDTSSGMGLIQLLKEQPGLNVVGRKPDADKQTRMSRQQGRFEAGRILLSNEAPWLADLENELLAFPGGHDDQVDALLLFLVCPKRALSPADDLLPADHRSARAFLAVGCSGLRRLVDAVLKRICWTTRAAVEPIKEAQISLITEILQFDFPDRSDEIPCSTCPGNILASL